MATVAFLFQRDNSLFVENGFCLGDDQPESYTMNGKNLDVGICLEVFAQPCDEDVHRTADEIIAVAPYHL